MKNFSIKEAFSKGWQIFKANKKKLIASAFIILVAGALQDVINKSVEGYGVSGFIIAVAIYLALVILKIGLTKMYLKAVDGEPLSLRELFSHSKLLVKYVLAGIALGLLVFVGFVLLIIPGIYLLLTYMFVPIIIIDDYGSIKEAFKTSAEMTKGVKWKLLGFFFLFALLNAVGAILFIVGLLVTLPVSSLAFLYIYRKLEKPSGTAVAV